MYCCLCSKLITDFSHAVSREFIKGVLVWFHDDEEAAYAEHLFLHRAEIHEDHPTLQ